MNWTLALSALDSLRLSAIETIPNAVPIAMASGGLKVRRLTSVSPGKLGRKGPSLSEAMPVDIKLPESGGKGGEAMKRLRAPC
jgi:hypothetical protein